MKFYSLLFRGSLLFFATILSFLTCSERAVAQSAAPSQAPVVQAPAVPVRITQAIDETQLVRLKGNVHPLARPEFDKGAVEDWQPMNRMLLLLQRSPEQQAALQQLMEEQLLKDSPNYHKWLTPQQFGAQFGPADTDIRTVTDWLTRHGFQKLKVGAGRTTIEFSGTVGQVRNAFHTEIHRYLVNGEARQANIADPQLPAALRPVVAGIVTLHNFPRKSMKRDAGAFVQAKDGIVKPLFTTTSGCGSGNSQPCYVVGPADFAKIYNLPPAATLNGAGVTIALVADSNINPQDVMDFRNLFALPANFTSANIILDGPDPGISGPSGDEGEADLDVQVAGMVAPGATINLVVSESTLTANGIDLSALYIIDNNIAAVMSESFGICEPALGTGGNQFYNAIWEQAAAQGITPMVSAGDNGSAGCDDFTAAAPASNGLAVSGIASTPFNVAVGGTDFDDVGTQTSFWSTSNTSGTRESAQGYIHEIPWNNSCAAAATSSNLNTICASGNDISAASGGPSSVYAKPFWQSGSITPADSHRDLPDISLFASNGPQSGSFYLLCEADGITPGNPPSCAPDAQGHFSFFGAGGTSASSPAFAGIMALINQQQGARQGNANPLLYKIAQSETFSNCNSSNMPLAGSATCVFYDVTKGNNSVPCAGKSSTTCSSQTTGTTGVLVTAGGSSTPAWTTGTGYDTATGLGSVNVTNLAAAWKTTVGAFKGTTTATKINSGTSLVTITHGQTVTLSATVASTSTGTPTGDVSFIAPTNVDGGVAFATLSGGTTSLTVPSTSFTGLPGGSYNLKAHYAGDGTFAPSDDPTGVPVVVNKENSGLLAEMVTFNSAGNITSTNATTFPYGSGPDLRFDILNHTGTASTCQPLVLNGVVTGCAFDATGSVTITDNGSPLAGSPLMINGAGHVEDQTIQLTGGSHALVATYGGDISYNASPAVNLAITVAPAATTASLTPSANPVPTNQQVTLSLSIASQSISPVGPSGSVTFKDGTTTIGTATVSPVGATSTTFAGGTASFSATFTTAGTHSLTAVYAGDTNYATSTSGAVSLAVGVTTTTAVTSSATSIKSGGSVTLTATVSGTGTGASPTGTVQFMNGTAALGTPATCTAVSGATPTCKATLTTTLAFLTPPSPPNRIPTIHLQPIAILAFVLLILFLIGLKRVPALHRRGYACAALLLLAGLVAGLVGCSNNYGGGGGTHYDNITAVYSGDTTYAGSTSPAITITIQ